MHREVRYLFEPYHLWTAIDPRTDMVHLFQNRHGNCELTADDVTPSIQCRFESLIGRRLAGEGAPTLVEKTPINALRIGYLQALAPGCRFIHIVRDGVDVARSIERLANANTYRIAGKPSFNQWWGDHDVKWSLLASEGARSYPDLGDMAALQDHAARGAYEWLLSLLAVDRWRSFLGDRLLIVRYSELTRTPSQTMRKIASFARLTAEPRWLDLCDDSTYLSRTNTDRSPLALPDLFLYEFQRQQQAYNFQGTAQPMISKRSMHAPLIA